MGSAFDILELGNRITRFQDQKGESMPSTLGVYLPDGILRQAAYESRLDGASKSEVVRFAWLRLFMSAQDAREIVFGVDLSETDGRVNSFIPKHELAMGRKLYPDMTVSEIARFALALIAGETPDKAREFATVKRGRPRKGTS
jgi:hypothetical protein